MYAHITINYYTIHLNTALHYTCTEWLLTINLMDYLVYSLQYNY